MNKFPVFRYKGGNGSLGPPGNAHDGLVLSSTTSRYLVLPERERLPNLASRALGLFLRRLSRDWEERWGNPVFAVESFVDETRYRGVCYRACGFEAVGPTAGFKRASRDFYHEHGEPKQLYLKSRTPAASSRSASCGRWAASATITATIFHQATRPFIAC